MWGRAPVSEVAFDAAFAWVSEAAFDAALASKDQATVQRAFDRFQAFRQRMEIDQEVAVRANVAQTFKRLGLPAPATNVRVD
jgi:hypothetical protein